MSFPNLSSTLANAIAVFFSGSLFAHIATSTYTQVKSALGVFLGGSVNTAGTTSTLGLYDGISSVVTMTIASPCVISWTGHPFVAGGALKLTTTGALATGLTAGTTVYVSATGLTANSFQVADTAAHAIAGTNSINSSGSQSGVQTAWDVSRPIGLYTTATLGALPSGLNGSQFSQGLIAISADGGGAADLTVNYV